MSKKILNSGTPPVVWSVLNRAIADSNSNFSELYLENETIKQQILPLVNKNIEATLIGSVRNSSTVVLDSAERLLYGNVTGEFVNVPKVQSTDQVTVEAPRVVIQSQTTEINSNTVKFLQSANIQLKLDQLTVEDSVKSVVVADSGKISLVPVSELILNNEMPIFRVAADDSTKRSIHYEETVKFSGINGIRVYSNEEGEIQIDGSGVKPTYEYISVSDGNFTSQVNLGSTLSVVGTNGISVSISNGTILFDGQSLQRDTRNESRTTLVVTTEMLMPNQTSFIDVPGYLGYVLYKIQTSSPAWVKVYTNSNNRTIDATRLITVDPSHTAGVVTEIVTTSSQPVTIAPGVIGFNDDFPVLPVIPIAVTNTTPTPRSVTVTLTVLQIEA